MKVFEIPAFFLHIWALQALKRGFDVFSVFTYLRILDRIVNFGAAPINHYSLLL